MADDKKRDDFTIEMGERNGNNFQRPISPPRHNAAQSGVGNNPIFPVLSYCASSILMTVTNKFVLSGLGFNLNFFLLCVQVCQRSGSVEGSHHANWGTLVCGLCRCNSSLQVIWGYHLSRLQRR